MLGRREKRPCFLQRHGKSEIYNKNLGTREQRDPGPPTFREPPRASPWCLRMSFTATTWRVRRTQTSSASVEVMPTSQRALLTLRPWTKTQTPTMPQKAGSGSHLMGESHYSVDIHAGWPHKSQTTWPWAMFWCWCCWWIIIVNTFFPSHMSELLESLLTWLSCTLPTFPFTGLMKL